LTLARHKLIEIDKILKKKKTGQGREKYAVQLLPKKNAVQGLYAKCRQSGDQKSKNVDADHHTIELAFGQVDCETQGRTFYQI